jgi:ornithine--oxo-acid transaminase
MNPFIEKEKAFGANNYHPLPVVLSKGDGVYLWDTDGKKYLDMMSAYSAVSFGHCHPRITEVLLEQASKLSVVSRAYYNEVFGDFLEKACVMTGMDKGLAMNSGAEAVETSLKAARRWAYTEKGLVADQAEIIACSNNFHGRTISIVGMSDCELYRDGFGPFPSGFKVIPYGDVDALEEAITPNTAAFLVEPIQGEGGIIVPPFGYLKRCKEICEANNVLLLLDEIQCGLGRTGRLLACEHEGVKPDGLILGKALGGGCMPISLFLASSELMSSFIPGNHGSTFGGTPLASAVGLASLKLLESGELVENSAKLGAYFIEEIHNIQSPLVKDIRGKGLFIGVEIKPEKAKARDICLELMEEGVLSKETHETVVRLVPPLIITKDEIDYCLSILRRVLLDK